MEFETAAKILRCEDEKVEGEFWIENTVYTVQLNEEHVYGIVKVDIKELEDFEPKYIANHHNMSQGEKRNYTEVEGGASLPDTNEELEAYVLKALKSNDGWVHL